MALIRGSAEADEIDVLGDTPGLQPQSHKGAANQQPLALEPTGCRRQDLVDPLSSQLLGHGVTIGAMDDAWEVLMAAGMPEGAIRSPRHGPMDPVRLRAAVAAVAADPREIDPWHVEPLLAWLRGFKHPWPPSFAAILGSDGERCLAPLEALPADTGSYLKLRRIAIENLSQSL